MSIGRDLELLEAEFQERKESIVALLHDASANYPPTKEDVHRILEQLNELFPELKDLVKLWKERPKKVGLSWFWWTRVPILDINRVIEKEKNQKPYHSGRAREVFALVLWLCYELLFKEDLRKTGDKDNSFQFENARRRIRSEKIIEGILFVNAKFKEITGSKIVQVLRDDVPSFFAKLPTRCEGRDDFSERIQSLASIFEVDLKHLRKLVPEMDPNAGSIKIINRWLDDKDIPHHEEVIDVWEKIKSLRNAPPAHPELKPRILEVLRFFGEKVPLDWTRLWDSILNKFAESLGKLQEMI